jgi:hypothetical protein
LRIARRSGEELGLLQVEDEPLKLILAQIETHTKHIRHLLEDNNNAVDLQWLEVLHDSTLPVYIEKKGHLYQAIFTPGALTTVINVMGLGLYAAALPAGWSFTPFPDKTEIWLSTPGATANVMFLATDHDIGVAI